MSDRLTAPNILTGHVQETNMAAGEEKYLDVTLPRSLTGAKVVCTPTCAYGWGGYISGHLSYRGDTNFTFCVKNNSSTTLPIGLDWIAVG